MARKKDVLWLAYHCHEYGGTLYAFYADHKPTEEEVVQQVLECAFEPDKEEWIQIDRAGKIKTVK